jgi:hypothetical protein
MNNDNKLGSSCRGLFEDIIHIIRWHHNKYRPFTFGVPLRLLYVDRPFTMDVCCRWSQSIIIFDIYFAQLSVIHKSCPPPLPPPPPTYRNLLRGRALVLIKYFPFNETCYVQMFSLLELFASCTGSSTLYYQFQKPISFVFQHNSASVINDVKLI